MEQILPTESNEQSFIFFTKYDVTNYAKLDMIELPKTHIRICHLIIDNCVQFLFIYKVCAIILQKGKILIFSSCLPVPGTMSFMSEYTMRELHERPVRVAQ